MLERLFGLLKKDITVAVRNYFFLIVLIVAALLIVTVNFLIPEEMNMGARFIYVVESSNAQPYQGLVQMLVQSSEHKQVTSRDQLMEEMKQDRSTIGLVLQMKDGKPVVEIVTQGYENERTRQAVALTIETMMNQSGMKKDQVEVVTLKDQLTAVKAPFNKSMVPILILTESVMLGFIFIATLLFMEKEEGTVTAYMVSPGGLAEYLGSKIIVMVLLGVISAGLITICTVGVGVNWLGLMGLVVTGSIFSSTIAIFISSFFDSLSKAMLWVMTVSLILTAPMISYFSPSFAPVAITVMPTYSMMFAFKEAIFPTGNPALIYQALAILGGLSLVFYIGTILSYRRNVLAD